MKILIYGINYAPELTGIGKYTGEMGAWLAAQGHQVDVITSMPYYPQWETAEDYKGKLWHTEELEGARVFRCPMYVPAKPSGMKRMIHEFSFVLSSMIWWIRAFFVRYDVVFCPYPPLVIGLLPSLYSWIRRRPFVFHVQDLQVDAARELNMIGNQGLLNFLEKMERFWMRQARMVSTISTGMRRRILEKDVPESKMLDFPNWVDPKALQPLTERQAELKMKYGFAPEDKVILYSGNMGEKQGLDIIPHVAQQVANAGLKDIRFFLVGRGGTKAALEAQVSEMGLSNIRFGDLVPYDELGLLLNMADGHLILQKKGATDLVMPSKLWAILSVGGTPLVTAEAGSTLRDLIEEEGIGLTAEPESTEALVGMIHQLQRLEEPARNEMRQKARQHIETSVSKEPILRSMEAAFEALAAGTPPKGGNTQTQEQKPDSASGNASKIKEGLMRFHWTHLLWISYVALLFWVLFFFSGEGWGADHFNRQSARTYHTQTHLFRSIFKYLRQFGSSNHRLWVDAALNLGGNILLLMPLGAGLALGKWRWFTTFLALIALALSIEWLQGWLEVGVADVDDVLLNVLGGIAGFWVWKKRFKLLPFLERFFPPQCPAT